jgi:hypothetical protein
LREQSGEGSQVLDCDFHRNRFGQAFAALNAFASSRMKRDKGKPQADAAKYHNSSQARSIRVVARLGLKRRRPIDESLRLAKSCDKLG